jgi:hypothetical protein
MLRSVKVCADSHEKEESRSAEVRHPADQEVEHPGLVDVFRFKGDIADEIARVVEGHEDHGEASNKVDGADAPIALVGSLEVGILNWNLPFSGLNFLEL